MYENLFISAYLLKDFLDCPRKVHFRLNFSESSVQNPDMIVGSIIHEAIERHWESEGTFTKFVCTKLEEHGLGKKYYEKALICMENFFSKFRDLLKENDLVEYRFKEKLYDKVFLVGKIDRVLEDGTVIDWKTSSQYRGNLSKDPQFILYRYVQKNVLLKPVSPLIRANLLDGTVTPYAVDVHLEGYLFSEIIPSVIRSVVKGDLPQTGLYTGKCFRCQYKTLCWKEIGIDNELDSSKNTDGHFFDTRRK